MGSHHGDEGYEPRGGVWILFVPAASRGGDGIPRFGGYSRAGMGAPDFAVGVSLGLGLHVGVSPLETLDFFTGLVTLDLGGDDVPLRCSPPESRRERPEGEKI